MDLGRRHPVIRIHMGQDEVAAMPEVHRHLAIESAVIIRGQHNLFHFAFLAVSLILG
jgi:hypothetical protein